MPELEVGWATEIAVLELSGSNVEDRGDHLVVRSPRSPTFHWGNCILVTDPGAAAAAARWIGVFHAAFPSAGWIAVGLTRMPVDAGPWREHEVVLEELEVLTTRRVPGQTAPPDGYEVRRLGGDDWEETVRLSVEENGLTGSFDPASYERFARSRAEATRVLCESNPDVIAYFGAFAEGHLAASLGVVCCGTTARYQNVLTARPHRGRGLASHLVGTAARWAAEQACDRWVIVTETTNPAGRVYRNAGFEPEGAYVQAYRPRSSSGATALPRTGRRG